MKTMLAAAAVGIAAILAGADLTESTAARYAIWACTLVAATGLVVRQRMRLTGEPFLSAVPGDLTPIGFAITAIALAAMVVLLNGPVTGPRLAGTFAVIVVSWWLIDRASLKARERKRPPTT